jgi:RNase P/RNase MRP subunit p29
MTRRFLIAGVFAGLIARTAPATAHDDYRIIGTITKVTANTLDVKQTKDGRTIAMATDEATLVTRDEKKVSAKELKAGLSVVVDASGDSLEDLVVLEIRIVPPATQK